MNYLLDLTKNFMQDEEGATAVEYGVLVALIIAACVVVIGTLGGQIEDAFSDVNDALETATATPTS
jgi:pilus assembly protein Flp/PilA